MPKLTAGSLEMNLGCERIHQIAKGCFLGSIMTLSMIASTSTAAQEAAGDDSLFQWQTNEIHFQYGSSFEEAFAPSATKQDTYIFTLQHADGWKYGDNFVFVDFSDSQRTGFDLYTELYSNFSLGKITASNVSFGPISDVGFITGINYAKHAKVLKYLPGIRLSWDIPYFAFFNTDVTAYVDDSRGVANGGAPRETDSFMVDINWALPFSLGEHDFSIEGHVEYIDGRLNEFGGPVKSHILGQPQFRYDLGKALFNSPAHFYAGAEYQFWINKLGDNDTDEHVLQFLLVARF